MSTSTQGPPSRAFALRLPRHVEAALDQLAERCGLDRGQAVRAAILAARPAAVAKFAGHPSVQLRAGNPNGWAAVNEAEAETTSNA